MQQLHAIQGIDTAQINKQNRTFTTKPVFCCYTCDDRKKSVCSRSILRLFASLFDKNETSLYFFVDSMVKLKLSSVQPQIYWGFCPLIKKNNG